MNKYQAIAAINRAAIRCGLLASHGRAAAFQVDGQIGTVTNLDTGQTATAYLPDMAEAVDNACTAADFWEAVSVFV